MLLQWPFTSQETITLATPNYGYEKRQRELAKKQKKEEKLRAKSQRASGEQQGSDQPEDGQPHTADAASCQPAAGTGGA